MPKTGALIGHGYTADVYEYGEGRILKLYRDGIPEIACERELDVTKAVYEKFGIAPKTYERIRLNGQNGIVYERILGENMMDAMFNHIWNMRHYSQKLAQYHYAIQKTVDFPLPRVKQKLRDDITAAKELNDEEKAKLFNYLSALPDGNALCHFDFHPGNILLRGGQPVIIDWMTGSMGDPLADVARTVILLKFGDAPVRSRIIKSLIVRFKKSLYTQYLKEYLKISGARAEDIQKWELPVAAARLREWISEDEKRRLLEYIHTIL